MNTPVLENLAVRRNCVILSEYWSARWLRPRNNLKLGGRIFDWIAMEERNYLFRVDWRCGERVEGGVFYGSSEDIALSYCLEFTAIRKYSQEPAWTFTVNKVLIDDVNKRYEELTTIFDQDGFVVPLPEVDLEDLMRNIRRVRDWRKDQDPPVA